MEGKQNKETLNKINNQITRIEQLIDKLLENLNIEEMSAYQRLTLAHRFEALHQRATKIEQTAMMTEDQPENEVIIVALMSLMRGETIKSDQIIDMEDAADGKNH